jgi:GGDEF domain-containing protein
MLSLKKPLDERRRNLSVALDRVVSILLQGISLYAFDYDHAEFTAFQAEIKRIKSDFANADNEDSALLVAGAAIRCLQQHSSSADEFVSFRSKHTTETIRALLESILLLSKTSAASAEKLRTIANELAVSEQMERIGYLAGELQTRTAEIGNGASETPAAEAAAASSPPPELSRLEATSIDPVTSLKGSADAIRAIERARGEGKTLHAFAFCLERLEMINVQFGFEAGDQVLVMFAQHIARHIQENDLLFRWRGPCFVVVTERRAPEARFDAEAARIGGARLEHMITLRQRKIFVPVVGSWNLFTISPEDSMEDFTLHVDKFAIGHERMRGRGHTA